MIKTAYTGDFHSKADDPDLRYLINARDGLLMLVGRVNLMIDLVGKLNRGDLGRDAPTFRLLDGEPQSQS